MNDRLRGLVPIAGDGDGCGAGDGEVGGAVDTGVMSWLIPGISESRRPKDLELLTPPDAIAVPDAAAVSPLPPREVFAEDRIPAVPAGLDGATDAAPRLPGTVALARATEVFD